MTGAVFDEKSDTTACSRYREAAFSPRFRKLECFAQGIALDLDRLLASFFAALHVMGFAVQQVRGKAVPMGS
jgi:hypothetical protein